MKREKYALQLDEFTDVPGFAQLIYIANGKLEELLTCMALSGICTSEDIFSAVETRLQSYGLSWERWISICTDGAMAGKHAAF